MYQKLKSFLEQDAYYYTALILLVGIASFGLGRQSVQSALEPVSSHVEKPALQTLPSLTSSEAPQQNSASIVSVIASKSGTKYHLPDCPGAKQIKSENLIEFTSIEAAKAAGYSPAGNCPGLE